MNEQRENPKGVRCIVKSPYVRNVQHLNGKRCFFPIVQYIDKLLWEEDRRKEGSHIKLMIDRSIDGWIDI